jgi:hypothetical protein
MPSIPKLLAKHLGKRKDLGFHAIVLTRIEQGVRDPQSLSGGTVRVETQYTCKARIDTMESRYWDFAGSAEARTRFTGFMILGATLAAGVRPRAGDTISSRGTTYTIADGGVVTVDLDTPATHLCACLAAGGG